MAIIQAAVPQVHLATAMGNPNRLLVEYGTDLLLPVAGPYLISYLRRDFINGLMLLNDFLEFAEDALPYLAAGESLDLKAEPGPRVKAKRRDPSEYGRIMTPAAQEALRIVMAAMDKPRKPGVEKKEVRIDLKKSLLARLAAPTLVFREMFDQKVLKPPPEIFSPAFKKAADFEARCVLVLEALLRSRRGLVPQAPTQTTIALARQAQETAQFKHAQYLRRQFKRLSVPTFQLLVKWLVAYHLGKTPAIPDLYLEDLTPLFGFQPSVFVKEWALNRRERMRLTFGIPDLRGPVGAEPVAPKGMYRREDYSSSQSELVRLVSESRQTRSTDALTLSTGSLRHQLDSVYYSGTDSLNQLTNVASNTLLTEERRNVVRAVVREVSEAQENTVVSAVRTTTSSTVIREAPGVDPKLSATHHRFKVVVPVTADVEMYDVGLTWCPRIANPFFELRQAIRRTFQSAYRSHLRQYYVPIPVSPPVVWETYVVEEDFNISESNCWDGLVVNEPFTMQIQVTDRENRPDLENATVVWNQSESMWNDDPDHFTIQLKELSYSGGTINGTVRLETDDGGADFQGFAHIEIPVLRYSQETVNALAAHEAAMQDYNLKRQALEAQAHQYARLREREFIERHERREPLLRLVFYALIRGLCVPTLQDHVSYYKEIISRCIDWTHAKFEFEPVALNALAYPEFEADHFVNSLWSRLFLPVNRGAEQTLFDALDACGSFQVQASVANALNQVTAIRNRLQQNGPDAIDQFTMELTIGEHVEAVMSAREHST